MIQRLSDRFIVLTETNITAKRLSNKKYPTTDCETIAQDWMIYSLESLRDFQIKKYLTRLNNLFVGNPLNQDWMIDFLIVP